MKGRGFLFLAAVAACGISACGGQAIDLSGEWENERGAVLGCAKGSCTLLAPDVEATEAAHAGKVVLKDIHLDRTGRGSAKRADPARDDAFLYATLRVEASRFTVTYDRGTETIQERWTRRKPSAVHR